MRKKMLVLGAVFGGLTVLVVMAMNYLVFELTGLPRVAFSIFDWLTRILPGGLITLMIDSMVSVITQLNLGPTSVVAKQVEHIMAMGLFFLLGILFGILLAIFDRRQSSNFPAIGLLGGVALAVPIILIYLSLPFIDASPVMSVLWIAFIFGVWGWVLAKLIHMFAAPDDARPSDRERRQFLYLVGLGSVTILVSAAGVSLLGQEDEVPVTGEQDPSSEGESGAVQAGMTSGPAESPPQSVLEERIFPAPGTRPELTSNENFYRIDINTMPPGVEVENWRLEVGGLVNSPLELSLEDLQALPAYSQVITLECISNRLGGDLISTSRWTGVRLRDVLEMAGLKEGALEIFIEAVDGFYESVPMEEAMDERTLLVYAMNGEPLPQEHGYPLRIYIPNHFGMKQPKWITRMEVIDHEGSGYWVERGWSETAIPPTTSVIDVVALDALDSETETLPVGGIAYSGARGISRVEVQVDGENWQEADLRTPPLSPLTWVQWRFDWQAEPGEHTFRVRAYDGNGELQPVEDSEPHPDGATGIHHFSQIVPQDLGGRS